MKPGSFEYHAPTTLDEALELLAATDDAKPLAGGQSLVPAMNLRLATPSALVDLNRLRGHDGVRVSRGELVIGMLVRHADLERPDLDDALGRLLTRTARLVGHLPIRVRGTFAGSIAHADPAAEWCMVARALDATVVARSRRRERRIAAADFFQGPFTTALDTDELVAEVRLPLLGTAGTAVREKSVTAGDFATVATVAVLQVEDGTIGSARVGIAGAETRPVRPRAAEDALAGAPAVPETLDAAARAAAEEIDPIADSTASSDYRRHLVHVLMRRALEDAHRESVA
jgi:carbon-monoxide dehydrogenase medium subunit